MINSNDLASVNAGTKTEVNLKAISKIANVAKRVMALVITDKSDILYKPLTPKALAEHNDTVNTIIANKLKNKLS